MGRLDPPLLLLLDEVAGGLTEHECSALVTLIKDVRASGISIVWIEHVVHALLAVTGYVWEQGVGAVFGREAVLITTDGPEVLTVSPFWKA